MVKGLDLFKEHNVKELRVTSQHANRFFERYGLVETSTTLHGWGRNAQKYGDAPIAPDEQAPP